MQTISPRRTLALVLAGLLLAACQDGMRDDAGMGPATVRNTALGPVLTDRTGMTLYTHKDDPEGGSVCFNRCARSWPPFAAAPADRANGRFSIVERKDGVRQWAYDDRALYKWRKDQKPGETTGHKVGGVWFAARP